VLHPEVFIGSAALATSRRAPPHPDALANAACDAKFGDKPAARTLILGTRASTRLAVRKVLGRGHPDLDDVAQEASIALLQSLGTFRGESSIANYARGVALRVALAARRRTRLRERWQVPTGPLELSGASDTDTPLSITIRKQRHETVLRILSELSPLAAEVLTLRLVSGHTVGEIARMKQLSEGSVRSKLRLAKSEFRRLLRREVRTGRFAREPFE
jgi:RNA polymerase sigma-70 factor (ECF subfamily)